MAHFKGFPAFRSQTYDIGPFVFGTFLLLEQAVFYEF